MSKCKISSLRDNQVIYCLTCVNALGVAQLFRINILIAQFGRVSNYLVWLSNGRVDIDKYKSAN